jgi:hypothetical protein
MILLKILQVELPLSDLVTNTISQKSIKFLYFSVPKSPSPNTYNLRSDFDHDKKKGFGFGCGR